MDNFLDVCAFFQSFSAEKISTMTVSHGLLRPARAATVASATLLLLLVVVVVHFRGTTAAAVQQDLMAADEDLMKASPLTVAQCRAGCLHKVGVVLNIAYNIQLCRENTVSIFFESAAGRL